LRSLLRFHPFLFSRGLEQETRRVLYPMGFLLLRLEVVNQIPASCEEGFCERWQTVKKISAGAGDSLGLPSDSEIRPSSGSRRRDCRWRIIVSRLVERRIIYSLSAGAFSGLPGFGLQLFHTKRISFSPSTHLFTSISLAMPMAKVAITKRETNTIDAAFMVNASCK